MSQGSPTPSPHLSRPASPPQARGRRDPRAVSVIAFLALALLSMLSLAGCVGPALPQFSDVEAAKALPIDGVYLLEGNQKRYRFEKGRAWILDTLVVGPIRQDPGQVVLQDIQQTGPRTYTGTDLALGAVAWTAEASEAGLSAISSTLPFPYLGAFTVVELDDPDLYARQLGAASILSASDSGANPNVGR